MEKICSTIAAYDNSKRVAKGKIALQLEIGPVTMSSEFLVLDVDPTYKAILGHPWLEQTLGVPSTTHQYFKFPFNGQIIKVKSIPTVETLNSITSEQMPPLFIPDKGKKPIMSIIDLPYPLDLNQYPFIDEEFESITCPQGKGCEVMAKIGYIHGQGLGRDRQGPVSSVQVKRLLARADLGDDVELPASSDESVEALSLSKENEVEEVDPEQLEIQLGDSDEEEYISDQNESDNEDVHAEFDISPTSEDEMENLKIWFEDDVGLLQVGGERVVGGDLLPFIHFHHRQEDPRPLHRYHRQQGYMS
ncbi:hypothetical protein Taro_016808 [Colocasia esculenta]|uniref:G-patch domain-containing protein n=1 Tax=Colocasia esculenta TaxID=4460 RepID=A0A843URA8_COLES|nr:hypothetical protein [Colocasia esculenta]